MAQQQVTAVNVVVGGRAYRMACERGDEARIESLAAQVDERISELAQDFGTVDDIRLAVMAAFSIADDLADQRRKREELSAELAALHEEIAALRVRMQEQEHDLATAAIAAAERIEAIAAELTPGLQG